MTSPQPFNHFKYTANDNYKAEGCLPWIKFLDRFDPNRLKRSKKIFVYLRTPGTHKSLSVQPCTSCFSHIKRPGLLYQTLCHIYSSRRLLPTLQVINSINIPPVQERAASLHCIQYAAKYKRIFSEGEIHTDLSS